MARGDREGSVPLASLLEPISGENPSGASLRYERLYDEIRNARREDDDSLSYGIWQHDLKRADWPWVESLCSQALTTQTKDLQIAGWLAEAWMMLEGVPGLTQGLDLVTQLTGTFWDTLYPPLHAEERSDELDYRSQFYDWLDKTLAARLVKLTFIPNELGDGISLATWLSAQRLDAVLKRAPQSGRLAKKAEQRGQINFKQCHAVLSRVPAPYGADYLGSLEEAQSTLQALKEEIDQKFPRNTLAFDDLGTALEEMSRVYKTEFVGRPQESETQPEEPGRSPEGSNAGPPPDQDLPVIPSSTRVVQEIQTREQAYKQLSEIATFLETIEPHSPAPQILRRVISWENKSLMDIFKGVGSSPEDLLALMRFLGIGS
jgi:type VI secretion system protein ImpA